MKKIIYSIILIGGFTLYILVQSKLGSKFDLFSDDEGVVTPPAGLQLTNTKTPATPKGQYKDGSYTGDVVNAYYGLMQVKVIISGGKITDVIFLQYPNDRSTSIGINTQAMPYLKAEAIKIQSAAVDGVSGASDSSQAFRDSLSSALSQAQT